MTDSAIQLSGDFCATILETVGALVVVLDREGRIVNLSIARRLQILTASRWLRPKHQKAHRHKVYFGFC